MTDIWFMLQDADRYVYHYTCAVTLAEKILPSARLRFSRFENVNDPRESKNWVFNYRMGHYDFDMAEQKRIERDLNGLLKHMWRVGCFVSDVDEALGTKPRGVDAVHAMYERGHSHPRMWSQYGEDYRGACLVFDRQQLDSDIQATAGAEGLTVYSSRVKYQNPNVVLNPSKPNELYILVDELNALGIDQYVTKHVQTFWRELYFVKAQDWEQEREYRWLVSANRDEDFFVDIKKSLLGILLGDQFPDSYKKTVGSYALENEVSVASMDWKNGFPQPMLTHAGLLMS